MRQLAILLLLLAAPSWAAASYYEDVQNLTGTPPVGAPSPCYSGTTCPLSIYTAKTMRVIVCALGGATLSGAGKVRLDLWVDTIAGGVWTVNRSEDLIIPAAQAGEECITWDRLIGVPKGYIRPTTDSITVSAGLTVKVGVILGF